MRIHTYIFVYKLIKLYMCVCVCACTSVCMCVCLCYVLSLPALWCANTKLLYCVKVAWGILWLEFIDFGLNYFASLSSTTLTTATIDSSSSSNKNNSNNNNAVITTADGNPMSDYKRSSQYRRDQSVTGSRRGAMKWKRK